MDILMIDFVKSIIDKLDVKHLIALNELVNMDDEVLISIKSLINYEDKEIVKIIDKFQNFNGGEVGSNPRMSCPHC